MGIISRLLTGNPQCTYCRKDGPWRRGGLQLCDDHRREMKQIAKAQPRSVF